MKKQILILLLSAGATVSAYAQYKTGIQASFGIFNVAHGGLPFAQYGGTIIHNFSKHWSADVGYRNWLFRRNGGIMLNHKEGEWGKPGTVNYRYSYNTIEGTARHNICNDSHNLLYAGIGPSFAWGLEERVPPYSNKFDGSSGENSYTELVPVHHIGGVAQLGYNRKLFQQRISLGMSGRFRVLSGDIGYYYDLGIDLGYHFNLVHRRVVRY